MSKTLQEFASLERDRKRIEEKLAKLKDDEEVQGAVRFKEAVERVMVEHDKTTDDLLVLFAPEAPAASIQSAKIASTKGGKARKPVLYTNPHTSEELVFRGGNNRTLRDWKATYGEEVVEGWRQPE